jgi:UDP-N-acetylmuramoylalanine--D-glutamate ligase
VSSYQLELLSSIKFDIAILINISPDHISRHGSFRNYIKIKESIFKNQKDQDLAIIGIDDKFSYEIYKRLKKEKRQKVIPISKNKKIPGGVYSSKGWLINDINLKKEKKFILKTQDIM